MQRLRSRGTSLLGFAIVPQLKKKTLNSWAAIQDSYLSTKALFESHRAVFTIGTSIASVATAWAGYSIRHYHESKIDQRLQSIENAMKNNHDLERGELKKLVDPAGSRTAFTIATAGTTLIIGYGLGWRGGMWYANRKYRREQLRLAGQLKPRSWQLLGRIKPRGWPSKLLKRPFRRHRTSENDLKTPGKTQNLI
ncbi:PREDICTED: uncharacterized protein LOC104826130 [Tarenaya hassleriana]|uniref:uncharacterized protein LOC104826130 n=1 Tax=Tarenaya hassleriana TaxID=28532 RepID=UPI00053C3CD7|nr:PREDICTED: uncharacterized protein LOC104826130 [Tarenaya hassleriana]